MADNAILSAAVGVGITVAADDIAGIHYPRSKISLGADGTAVDAGAGAGVVGTDTQRVTLGSDDPAVVALQLIDNAISGAGFNVTQFAGASVPIGAGVEATAVRVTLATDSTGVVSIDDNGAAITVDGTVTANAGSGTFTIAGAVTNAGTFVVQIDGTALTRLTDIETNTDSLAVVGNGAAATAVRVTLANDSTGIVALTTSTASIGKLASNAGVTIGAVEIAAAQTLATVTTVTTCSTVTTCTTLTGSAIAHDGADSGNPHKIGARALTSVSAQTLVAANDRTDLFAGLDGVLITRDHCNLEDIVTATPVAITDGSSTSVLASPGAGIRNYITSISIANSSATFVTVDLRDGTAGAVLWTVPVPATGGVVYTFPVPLKFSAATAVAADPSASASTITVSVLGFKSKV
jgi:hypothetical protein